MSTATLVPVDEYLSSSYSPDCEFVDGELIQRNVGESDHAGLQGLLTSWFLVRRKQLDIHVFPTLRLQTAPGRYRVPDITVTTTKIRGRILREPPLLCIEILSPEDRASRTEMKIDEYLHFGVKNVWLIDPRQRRAWSYTQEGKREGSGVLTIPDPPMEVPIFDLLTELEDDIEPFT